MTQPDFLVVGHITKDIKPTGYTLGGTATYAAVTAHRLGVKAAIVTSAADDVDLSALDGIAIYRAPSPYTSTFENIYADGHRTQYLRAVAAKLDCNDVPPDWRAASTVLLGPLTQEVDPNIVDCFRKSIIGVTPQGWMRAWDDEGRVSFTPWASAGKVLSRANALIYSIEDVHGDYAFIDMLGRLARIMIVTEGVQGANLYQGGTHTHFSAYKANEVDPTGAGDVFAAAFLIRLQETGDEAQAMLFAAATASFAVEAPGIAGLPTREQVMTRMQAQPD
ncbi:MAG: PfkB family carbohydrate kinase [Anaerolineae bacterium]